MRKTVDKTFRDCGTCAYWKGDRTYKMRLVHFDDEEEAKCMAGKQSQGLFGKRDGVKPKNNFHCSKWKQFFD